MGIFGRRKKEEDKSKGEAKPEVKPAAKKDEAKSMKDLYRADKPAAKTRPEAKKKAGRPGNAYKTLVKPLITEKAANLGAQNKYVFEIGPKSNKIEVARAVAEVYGIEPVSVNIIRMSGKRVRYGRVMGRKKNWKKAIVTLPRGKSINIYEGV